MNAVDTAVRDLRDVPLAQVGDKDVARLLARVLPDVEVESVPVAAFNSSI